MCFLPCSFISTWPAHVPMTAGAPKAASSSIFSRGSCLTSGGHADSTQTKNVKLAHAARANTPGDGPLSSIFANRLSGTAGFSGCILSPERAEPLAACDSFRPPGKAAPQQDTRLS